ncbi:6934_t:CDS:1, partial [Paraglomus occultum]
IRFWEYRKAIRRENEFLPQKIISGLSETVKHLGYDIREVRDGVARSSNAGPGTSKTPENYTGTISDLWEDIDALFKEKKSGLWQGCIQRWPRKSGNLLSTIRRGLRSNFHKKLTKNPKEDTLDSLKLWVSKQKGEIDTEPESEAESSDSAGPSGTRE